MKIEIGSEELLKGVLDLDKFEKIMKSTPLNIQEAITESMSILKNKTGWTVEYLVDVLIAEIDWGVVLMNFGCRKADDKLYFKMLPIKFKNKVEYEKYAKSPNFRNVILKERRKDGEGIILINSFTPDPEHNIDMWLSKSTFPYPESEWKKTIIDT